MAIQAHFQNDELKYPLKSTCSMYDKKNQSAEFISNAAKNRIAVNDQLVKSCGIFCLKTQGGVRAGEKTSGFPIQLTSGSEASEFFPAKKKHES